MRLVSQVGLLISGAVVVRAPSEVGLEIATATKYGAGGRGAVFMADSGLLKP